MCDPLDWISKSHGNTNRTKVVPSALQSVQERTRETKWEKKKKKTKKERKKHFLLVNFVIFSLSPSLTLFNHVFLFFFIFFQKKNWKRKKGREEEEEKVKHQEEEEEEEAEEVEREEKKKKRGGGERGGLHKKNTQEGRTMSEKSTVSSTFVFSLLVLFS